jgi:hypothetical protein
MLASRQEITDKAEVHTNSVPFLELDAAEDGCLVAISGYVCDRRHLSIAIPRIRHGSERAIDGGNLRAREWG